MKKVVALTLLVALCFLTSCTQSEFIQADSFIERFNKQEGAVNLDFSSFYILEENPVGRTYNCNLCEGKILLRLVEDENMRITMCRVVLPKVDENLKQLKITDALAKEFELVCRQTAGAYTNEAADEVFSKLAQSKKNGEATYTCGSFHYVLFETQLCTVFSVQNRWLKEVQTTLKPESKADFVWETSIRTETVPHR